jgi:hypothetical protein
MPIIKPHATDLQGLCIASIERFSCYGSSPFSMGKVIFQFNRVGFFEDIHTKQRRADVIHIYNPLII